MSERTDYSSLRMFEDTIRTDTLSSTASTAPERYPQYRPRKKLEVLKDTPQVKRQRKIYREKQSFITTLKVVGIALAAVLIVGTMIFQRAKINMVEKEISATQKMLDEEKGENVRLSLVKEAMVSPAMVDKYAEKKGMIKRDSYNIKYFDLSYDDVAYVSED